MMLKAFQDEKGRKFGESESSSLWLKQKWCDKHNDLVTDSRWSSCGYIQVKVEYEMMQVIKRETEL